MGFHQCKAPSPIPAPLKITRSLYSVVTFVKGRGNFVTVSGSLSYHLRNGFAEEPWKGMDGVDVLGMLQTVCCEGWEPSVPSDGSEGLRDGGRSLTLCFGFLEKGSPNYCCPVPVSAANGPQCCGRQTASLSHPPLPGGVEFQRLELVLAIGTTVGCRLKHQGCLSALLPGWGTASRGTNLFQLPHEDVPAHVRRPPQSPPVSSTDTVIAPCSCTKCWELKNQRQKSQREGAGNFFSFFFFFLF